MLALDGYTPLLLYLRHFAEVVNFSPKSRDHNGKSELFGDIQKLSKDSIGLKGTHLMN